MLAPVASALGWARVPGAVRILVGLCLVAALLGVGLGLSGSGQATAVTSVLIGIACLVAGVLLIRLADTGPTFAYRRWFGMTLVAYALGVLFGVFAPYLPRWVGVVADGILIICVGVTFVVGVAKLPAVPQPYKVLRSTLEALLVGFASGGFLFRITLEHQVPLWTGFGLQVILIVILTIFSLAIISVSLDRGRGMMLAVLGTCIITAGESSHLLTSTTLGVDNWPGRVVSAIGWSLAICGLFLMPAQLRQHPDVTAPRIESRNLTIVGTMIVLSAGAFLGTFAFLQDPLPTPTWLLCSIFLLLLWSREVVRARQSEGLLQQLEQQVRLDPLTGAGNRRALESVLERFSATRVERIAFLTIDLDGFKDVNDQLGHNVGDELLILVTGCLQQVAQEYDAQVFRVGGDEFAAVAAGTPVQVEEMADQMVASVRQCGHNVPGLGQVSIGASIGVRHLRVVGGFTAAQAHAALGESGHAMRAAKVAGRSRVVVFDRGFAERHRRRRMVEARLADPSTPRPDVHYQPVVCLNTGHMVGVEALARWSDPVLGVVAPSEFVDIAENRGLIHALGDHILNVALDDARKSGLVGHGLTVSVNVSIIQLRVPGFVDLVAEALRRSGVPSELLILEVTETIFVRQDDPALRTIAQLGKLGVGFSLDDFGAGYSSLSRLSRLPVRTLKVDKSITERLSEAKTQAIVRSVVEMANGLGLMVVLEGVENARQVEQARALGVGHAQGWYFRAALVPEALQELLGAHAGLVLTSATEGEDTP